MIICWTVNCAPYETVWSRTWHEKKSWHCQVLRCEKINQYPVGIDFSHGPTQKNTLTFMHCNVSLLKVSQLKACVNEINTALDTAGMREQIFFFLKWRKWLQFYKDIFLSQLCINKSVQNQVITKSLPCKTQSRFAKKTFLRYSALLCNCFSV